LDDLTEEIRRMSRDAGFIRAGFLTPFRPEQYIQGPPAEGYQVDAPALLIAGLAYGNQGSAGTDSGSDGYIAPFAQRNYYREAVTRLKQLAKDIRLRYGGKRADFRILCNSPLPEKPLAAASGLGSLGRNGLIITPEAGSLIVLGAMTLPFALSGYPAEAEIPFRYCRRCDSHRPPCAAACPTGAVLGNGRLDRDRCIQWYASGHGEQVPPEIIRVWGNRLYGCTNCQDVCVHNQRRIQGLSTEAGSLPPNIDPRTLLSLSDGELKARFKGTALGLSWLGVEGIRRNARLILEGAWGKEGA
jgi:epoxyqueuosine reductase